MQRIFKFYEGGCGGNQNNFANLEDCSKECGFKQQNPIAVPSPSQDICGLEAITGLCRAYFPRFFFNKTSGVCEEFIYG
jgi:hypothetical protein